MKKRTWGKVDWNLNKEDPEIDIWFGSWGPSKFAMIEDYGGDKYQPYIFDKKTGEWTPIAIPYTSLSDLKRQLEEFKE